MAGRDAKDDYEVSPLDSQFGEDLDREQTLSDIGDDGLIVHEPMSGPDHAPIPVSTLSHEREAPKEVVNSWQAHAREDDLPIPVEKLDQTPSDTDLPIPVQEHDASTLPEAIVNTSLESQPPSYESIESIQRVSHSSSQTSATASPTLLEPDISTPPNVLPRSEDRSAVGQLLSWLPPRPTTPSNTMPRLFQPLVIPQIEVPPTGETVPFVRCYSSVLASHDVSQSHFLAFLDGFALALAPNAALQGLRVVGAGMSKFRLALLPLAGKGISALASIKSGHSSSRARLYLDRCQVEFFGPRGLRLSVVKDEDLYQRLNLAPHSATLAPLTKHSLGDAIPKRRFEAISPYVCPLRFDVPPEDAQVAGVQRLARKQLDGKIRRDRQRLDSLRDRQWRQLSPSASHNPAMANDFAAWTQRYVSLCAEIRRLQGSLADLTRSEKVLHVLEESTRGMLLGLEERQVELQKLINVRPSSAGFAQDWAMDSQAEIEEASWGRRLRWVLIENA